MRVTFQDHSLVLEFMCVEELQRWMPERTTNAPIILWLRVASFADLPILPVPSSVTIKVGNRHFGTVLPLGETMAPSDLKNFQRIMDLMRETDDFMMLTDNTTHQCILANDRASSDRLVWPHGQFSGVNLLHFWRDSMQSLSDLQRGLRQDGIVENFKYQLYRPDDSIGEYVKTYELVDFGGRLCRLSRSHDWRLVAPAPTIT